LFCGDDAAAAATRVGHALRVPYDPSIYEGTAAYYARGRPPYSRALVSTLMSALDLDGSGRLLDVGCGPGILTMELASTFNEVIGLDPDADMLTEGARRAGEPVAEAVYEILEPGGAIALIVHTVTGRPVPSGPGYPPIPHEVIRGLIDRYLGTRRRAGQGFASPPPDRYEDALGRTRFGRPDVIFAEGRADIVQDIDGVLANYYSTSFCAPHLFGDRRDAFEAEMRAALAEQSPRGLFWDWPGDTEILIARKRRQPGG
jgi:SAM-dependent methyltransferase